MTEYDPNLPQEFSHMPKRRGMGPVLLLLAIVAAFALAVLLGTLGREEPTASGPASSQERAATPSGAAPQSK